MDELKPCQTDEVGKLVEATAQTLDERCKIWQETLNRAYKDGKYNKNTGIWEADEYRVARARYTLDAYCDALALVDTLGQQIDDLRRAAPENKPLTVDELRRMGGERVWTQFRGLGMYGLVAYHSDPDGDDGDDVYITNNLGGRSTFEEILSQGGTVYARKPEQEGGNE